MPSMPTMKQYYGGAGAMDFNAPSAAKSRRRMRWGGFAPSSAVNGVASNAASVGGRRRRRRSHHRTRKGGKSRSKSRR